MTAPANSDRAGRVLLDQLVEAGETADRLALLERHPELRESSVVERLCDRSARQLRVSVAEAERTASAASWLAHELDDPYLVGRSLRTTANVLHVRGDVAAAVDRYEEALERFEASGHEVEAAITRSSALQALSYLGRYAEVHSWAQSAREVFDRAGDRLRIARLQVNLGTIAYRQDRLKDSLELLETAYRELLEIGSPQDVALCLRDLATLHVSLHNLHRAEEVYAQARDYCRRSGLAAMEVEADYNIAYLYYLRGQYTRAIDLYRATRQKCDEAGEVYHRALCDLDESEIYLELNLVEEQMQAAEAAYFAFERLGLAYEQAKALTLVALGKIRQRQFVVGVEILDRARQIFARERNRVWVAMIDLYKALTLAKEGRRFEAVQLTRGALQTFEANGLTSKAAVCHVLQASLDLAAGEVERARRICRSILDPVRSLDRPDLEHQVQLLLGQIEETSGRYPEAFEAYRGARVSLESHRSRLQAQELKIGLVDDRLQVYESLVRLLAEERVPAAAPGAAFEHIEQAKARSISDMMAFRGVALTSRATAHSAQAERVRRLREELNWCQRQIEMQDLAGERMSSQRLAELEKSSRRNEEELAATLRDLEKTDREFTSLQNGTAASVDETRKTLPTGAVLLEFYFARDTVYVCVVGQNRLAVVPVSVVSRVRELHEDLFTELASVQAGPSGRAKPLDRALGAVEPLLRKLYDELLGPVAPLLEASQLFVVPHRFLHHLPFHALHNGETYLGQIHSIVYAPSADVFSMCHARPPSAGRSHLLLSAAGTTPGAQEIAEALVAALHEDESLVEREATIENLRSGGRTCRRLHLDAHVCYRQDNPMFSFFELGDGHLSLFDLFGLRLDAEMVTLRGAGIELGELTNGQAWVSLARGLLYAGTRSALIPLWNGPEDTTSRLLASFYGRLGTGTLPALALQQAMAEIRAVRPHPGDWACFALVGSPGLAD